MSAGLLVFLIFLLVWLSDNHAAVLHFLLHERRYLWPLIKCRFFAHLAWRKVRGR
jgi:hypothetical protein